MLPRKEYEHSSNGGAVADWVQMIDGDFQVLLDKLDALGLRDNTILIFAGDNGRDTSFDGPGKQEHSNQDGFMMFFDTQLVGMCYKNFKVLTHKVDDGAAPIEGNATCK